MKIHRFLQGITVFLLITLIVATPLTVLAAKGPTSGSGFIVEADSPRNSATQLPTSPSPTAITSGQTTEPLRPGAGEQDKDGVAYTPAPTQGQEAPKEFTQQPMIPNGGQMSGQQKPSFSQVPEVGSNVEENDLFTDAGEGNDADTVDDSTTITVHAKEGASKGYIVIRNGQDGWEVKSEVYPSLLLIILFHVFSIIFTCAFIFAIAQLIVALRRKH